jgi:DnaJ-class molecular chaperone
MGRNNKDFKSCPECYGRGYLGWVSQDKSEYSMETCPTCKGNNVKSEADQIEDSFARADMDMGK